MLERSRRDGAVPVLEADYLERLRLHLGPEGFAELLADGLIEVADRLHRLRELARASDTASVERFAHDLVGLAGNLGLARLARAAAALQRAARGGREGDLDRHLAHAIEEGAAGEEALRALLASSRSP